MRRKRSVKRRPIGRPPKEPVERGPDPAFITIDEFCAMFAIHRASWPKHRPFLETIKFGARVLIPRAELERYIELLRKPAQKVGVPKGVKPPAPGRAAPQPSR